MKLIFCELEHDYNKYIYPYEVWCELEHTDTPETALKAGFLAASSNLNLDRYYLCRSGRINLRTYSTDQRTRYIIRKGRNFKPEITIDTPANHEDEIRELAEKYFSTVSVKSDLRKQNFYNMIRSPFAKAILEVRTQDQRLVSFAPLLIAGRSCQYGIPIYDPDLRKNQIGHYTLISLIHLLKAEQYDYLYVGTCYNSQSLYKTRFAGFQFFDGRTWNSDRELLKILINESHSS